MDDAMEEVQALIPGSLWSEVRVFGVDECGKDAHATTCACGGPPARIAERTICRF